MPALDRHFWTVIAAGFLMGVLGVVLALLELTPDTTVEIDGERRKVLGSAWVDGFEALQDRDYDPVRAMAKRTNMPPYQEY